MISYSLPAADVIRSNKHSVMKEAGVEKKAGAFILRHKVGHLLDNMIAREYTL
jgi:hypothetical protein